MGNLLAIKQEEIEREKNIINNLSKTIEQFINDLSKYLNNFIKIKNDMIYFKERIINNSKYINNNYYIYKNIKNIEFNMKNFDEKNYMKEKDIIKKLKILLDYFNKPYSIDDKKIFNAKTKENINKNTFIINDFINNDVYHNCTDNFKVNNKCITSLIIFDEKKMNSLDNINRKKSQENIKINNPNNFNENIFAYSTNKGDVNFYKIEKNNEIKRVLFFYLFPNNKEICDMIKIRNNRILCNGYDELKMADININEKTYNIVNTFRKDNINFNKNWALTDSIILTYSSNEELYLIEYDNLKDKINNCTPWLFLSQNDKNFIDIDNILINGYKLISLIKLQNGKHINRFVISISNNNNNIDNNNNNNNKEKDLLLFYNINNMENRNSDKKIKFENLLYIPSIENKENNIFEISYHNLLICKLQSPLNKFAIINTNNYTIEKIVQLTNYSNNIDYFDSLIKYKSLYFKGDYYLSINKNMNLTQWYFDFNEKTFIPIDDLSLKFIKENNKF
jgi:hypothetical protein